MGLFKLNNRVVIILAILLLPIGYIAWDSFMLPSSVDEAVFRYRLGSAANELKNEIRLSDLTSFEWAEVCDHHPYEGDFTHPKFGKTYSAPMRAAHDGAWSLLFIKNDGTPIYITGSCNRGGASIRGGFGCLLHSEAILPLVEARKCPIY